MGWSLDGGVDLELDRWLVGIVRIPEMLLSKPIVSSLLQYLNSDEQRSISDEMKSLNGVLIQLLHLIVYMLPKLRAQFPIHIRNI